MGILDVAGHSRHAEVRSWYNSLYKWTSCYPWHCQDGTVGLPKSCAPYTISMHRSGVPAAGSNVQS